jgi:hypothetical protein
MRSLRSLMTGRLRDERGMAMVTALLASVVAMILGATVMQLSIHTSRGSAYDRARTQAVHAAEAGLDQAMSHFATTAVAALPCELAGTLNATPVANWSVQIDYYATHPPSGSPLPCVSGFLDADSVPGSAALESTGTVTGWEDGTVERFMQSQVSMEPIYGTFDKAIFSDNSPGITNNLQVNGENGNDADVLTNGNFVCSNSLTVYGSIYAQGSATLSNSCHTTSDLWANGSISMSNTSRADHDVMSSTGSLTMGGNSYVGNNIKVAGTCTGCTGRYGGTKTTGYAQGPPPSETWPEITFDADAWIEDGYEVGYYTECATPLSWITNSANAGVKKVLRITGGCTLTFSQNTTTLRTEDLAIVTDGEIVTSNNTSFQSNDSGWHSLYLIVENSSSCTGSDGRVTLSNLTQFTKLYFFVYSPCVSTFANNNSTGRGQVYGKTVTLANNLTFTFHAMLVPGAGTITGFDSKVQFVREVN